MKRKFKTKTFIVWIIFAIVAYALYKYNSNIDVLKMISEIIITYPLLSRLMYLTILSLIGFTFIPSTPLTIGGVFIFGPVEAFFMNITGILISTTLVYYFSEYLHLHEGFKTRFPKKYAFLKKTLKEKETIAIIIWSTIPFVPTDLIIYLCNALKIPLKKCLTGVTIGEGALNLTYIIIIVWLF